MQLIMSPQEWCRDVELNRTKQHNVEYANECFFLNDGCTSNFANCDRMKTKIAAPPAACSPKQVASRRDRVALDTCIVK